MSSDSAIPADQFMALVGPIIGSALNARAELTALDRSVTDGILTPCERRARSTMLIRHLHELEADLAFWLPPDGINSLREAISAGRRGDDVKVRAARILAEVWITMETVLVRDARLQHWKTEQARKFPLRALGGEQFGSGTDERHRQE